MNDTAMVAKTIPATELKGVGGWLAWRIFVYLVWCPLRLLGDFSWLGLCLVGLYVAAGIYLWRVNPLGVRLAKIAEGITIALGVGLLLLSFVSPSVKDLLRTAVMGIGGGTVWLAYFYTSVRVKNTYFPVVVDGEKS